MYRIRSSPNPSLEWSASEVHLTQLPALITTVHDPDLRLLPMLEDCGAALTTYQAVYAFVTEPTHPDIFDALDAAGVQIVTGPGGMPGAGQRRVLAEAVEAGHKDMLVCDFDRWLHWVGSYPEELLGLHQQVERDHAGAWFVCLGRSKRAFASHPLAQQWPEAATNQTLSSIAGKPLDATAGASWVRRPGAVHILVGSTVTTKATDLEWPGLVLIKDRDRVQGAFVEGLEFETADAYREEITRCGSLETWIRETYDRPDVLRDRLQLASDSISALLKVVGD